MTTRRRSRGLLGLAGLMMLATGLLTGPSCSREFPDEPAAGPPESAHQQLMPKQYRLIDLGPGYAKAINSTGQVVCRRPGKPPPVYSISSSRLYVTVLWDQGRVTELVGGGKTYGFGLNDRGDIVGISHLAKDGPSHAFLWRDKSLTSLGTSSWASAINNAGQIVGRTKTKNSAEGNRAFIWQGGKMADLNELIPPHVEWMLEAAIDINESGQIACDAIAYSYRQAHVLLYHKGSVTDLGTLGGTSSSANGINNKGHVVGMSSIGGDYRDPRRAFLWDGKAMINLGTLGGLSCARAINSHGHIVGLSVLNDEKRYLARRAVIFRDGRVIDLNDLVPDRRGWLLREASDINDRGQICGTARVPTTGRTIGAFRAFLLDPI